MNIRLNLKILFFFIVVFFLQFLKENQGIITKIECCTSTVGSDEAADFFQSMEEGVKSEHINIC